MNLTKAFIFFVLILTTKFSIGQQVDLFLEDYHFYKLVHSEKAEDYKGIEGTPYLEKDFTDGVFRLKDSSLIKLPIRYNMYSDELEYRLKDINYVVGNRDILKNTTIGKSVFVYMPSVQKGGYFELLEAGKCSLVVKRKVIFKPAEGPKPIEAKRIPARFEREPDVYFLIVGESEAVKAGNLKSVINALQDRKPQIENFIEQEKIKNTRPENLVKIVKYYNTF